MLVLFETPAGFALFKLHDDGKLENAETLFESFKNIESAKKLVSLLAFRKFEDTADALAAATAIVEGKLSKNLKKFLTKSVIKKDLKERLAVADAKLKTLIREKLGIETVYDDAVMELFRCIRFQLKSLLSDNLTDNDMKSMVLGLSHSLSRYKIKFSPDKVDIMIVQAISLLDDLDKEINTYSMRIKEWYGWHFPELSKIVGDNIQYARVVQRLGSRARINTVDLTDVVEASVAEDIKAAAQISMGTELAEEDVQHIQELCAQTIEIAAYREQLYEYIKNRMRAIAPNLTLLVGELVGARLIAHAGSLLNLAKYPASTVQILGAEKALFRALKNKKQTPKYGLIYHASLVGQTAPKFKGKISRVLANKTALSIRVDALGDKDTKPIGVEGLEAVQARIRQLEGDYKASLVSKKSKKTKLQKYDKKEAQENHLGTYNPATDTTFGIEVVSNHTASKQPQKTPQTETPQGTESTSPVATADTKHSKKRKHEETETATEESATTPSQTKHKKHKKKQKVTQPSQQSEQQQSE
jgi:nucleolar protein 58